MEVIRYVLDPLDASHPYLALILDMKLLSRLDIKVQALLSAEGHQCADFLARLGSGHDFVLQQWDSPAPRMEVACLRH